ncbi:MAG: nucleotidyl transferase AbiEii/AbiGii toxin family protein [Chloroflexota bacterium]|nr:nucleotidyl transferase AbiEii/AbiGii toxin family protein [Chloroflexota bacterium]
MPSKGGRAVVNGGLSEIVKGWLTPLQVDFLTRFFATGVGASFFLTDGTALSAFYLHHRLSEDLDLFTLDDLALREAVVLIPQLAANLGCRLGPARRTKHFSQIFLEPEAGIPLKIELVRDFGPQYGEHIEVGSVIVDSLENIGANKLTAILGRTEPKDFVDLLFILRAGYDFDEMLTKAQGKDLGMQPFFMAGSLLQVRNFHHLPATTPPLTLPELQSFIVPLADRLLDQAHPPESRET